MQIHRSSNASDWLKHRNSPIIHGACHFVQCISVRRWCAVGYFPLIAILFRSIHRKCRCFHHHRSQQQLTIAPSAVVFDHRIVIVRNRVVIATTNQHRHCIHQAMRSRRSASTTSSQRRARYQCSDLGTAVNIPNGWPFHISSWPRMTSIHLQIVSQQPTDRGGVLVARRTNDGHLDMRIVYARAFMLHCASSPYARLPSSNLDRIVVELAEILCTFPMRFRPRMQQLQQQWAEFDTDQYVLYSHLSYPFINTSSN